MREIQINGAKLNIAANSAKSRVFNSADLLVRVYDTKENQLHLPGNPIV
jgi:hypothetical protein